ncbi:G-protein coupled receptor 83-like [Rhopilema esculentum]|uniref:G-protein coupled receptor 83-like n=1 Tax=Rhopilema esculentum TaxID=499914 RepID=UPI0031E4337F|eukprot:gene4621-20895_t
MNYSRINLSIASNSQNDSFSCPGKNVVDRNLQVVLFSLIIIVSLIGNFLIVAIVIKNKRMHTLSNLLIMNISLADLLVTLLPMVWEIVRLGYFTDGTWPLGSFMCVFAFFCVYMSVACSVLSLSAVSIDRYYLIVKPHSYSLKNQYIKYIIFGIWASAFCFALPTILMQRVVTDKDTGKKQCVEAWKNPFDPKTSPRIYTAVLFVFLYVIPLMMMTVLYSKLCLKLWMRNSPESMISKSRKKAVMRKRKVVIMLIFMVLIFAIGWFPIFLVQFMTYFDSRVARCAYSIPESLIFVGYFFEYLSSALNPYVYFVFSESFRHGLATLFQCQTRGRPRARSGTVSRLQLSKYTPSPTAFRDENRIHRNGSLRVSPDSDCIERRPSSSPMRLNTDDIHFRQTSPVK